MSIHRKPLSAKMSRLNGTFAISSQTISQPAVSKPSILKRTTQDGEETPLLPAHNSKNNLTSDLHTESTPSPIPTPRDSPTAMLKAYREQHPDLEANREPSPSWSRTTSEDERITEIRSRIIGIETSIR